MNEESSGVLEKVLSDANQKDVTLIADGLTRQHFIELDVVTTSKGHLYESQIKTNEWKTEKKTNEAVDESTRQTSIDEKANDVFATEVNDRLLAEARSRLASRLSGFTPAASRQQFRASLVETLSAMRAQRRSTAAGSSDSFEPVAATAGIIFRRSISKEPPTRPRWYLAETAQKIKEELSCRGGEHYEQSLVEYERGEYAKALIHLNKAFLFNSLNIQFYLLRYECLVRMGDFRNAILTINKLMAMLALYIDEAYGDTNYDELRQSLLDRIVFCLSSIGQIEFEKKNYLDAYEAYNKAGELKPDNFEYLVKSVSCLCELDRGKEAIHILTSLINENDESKKNAKLYVLRANVYIKENEMSKAYYDLKEALTLDPDNDEAQRMLTSQRDEGERLRNAGVIYGLNNRLLDGIEKLTHALEHDPDAVEYMLQRGVLFKRRRDFNSAIDDFLNGISKLSKQIDVAAATAAIAATAAEDQPNTTTKQQLMENFQRQVLLTYNDFAIQCYEKGFYDDAIVLLNKAIKAEKKEKGFYVNRGDCFYKKNDKKYALLDYEQANEIDPKDEEIKMRIAKIYYEFAIEKYNDKNYKESTKCFDKAIKYEPKNCKYYISRARTLYLSGEKVKAQIDICSAILLDPSNQEIPDIISRIFVNYDLNEVLSSEQMNYAKARLEKLNIPTLFDWNKQIQNSRKNEIKKRLQRPNRLQPSLNDYLKEEAEIMKIVEEKKQIKEMLKVVESMQLKEPIRPKLKPIEKEKFDVDKRMLSKEINWRRFKSGIGSSV